MTLTLKDYQQECLDHAKEKNTIVHLHTGLGKTLIAARLIDYHRELSSEKRIIVLVPTRALVEQQAGYFEKHCQGNIVVQKCVGDDQADWQAEDWSCCLDQYHVLVGTAAIFQQAMVTSKFLDIGRLSLIVFDECHNATGNSPMAIVMRDAVAPHYLFHGRNGGPRILGLTASFDNGNCRNLAAKRRKIEELLQSSIICPDVTVRTEDDKFDFVPWERTPAIDDHKSIIEDHVQQAVYKVAVFKDFAKVLRACTHVYEELGLHALFFYIDRVIVAQLREKAQYLESSAYGDGSCKYYGARLREGLPILQQHLKELYDHLETDGRLMDTNYPGMSKKVEKLIETIDCIHNTYGKQFRGIIFVEQVALVSTLAKVLNDRCGRQLGLRFGAVAGTSYQSESEREEQLQKFHRGELYGLVSSAALKEGIDVSACGFVIRFTSIATTKAHIQGSGRARHKDAIIFYFENDPIKELQKEHRMTATASRKSLSLNETEMKRATVSVVLPRTMRHPYPSIANEGQVNVYNCKQIFIQYCSGVLAQTVRPDKDLFKFYKSSPGEPKRLSSVRFPTPNGWQYVTDEEYRRFWHGIDIEREVFQVDRTKNKSTSKKEEMCFCFIVVVNLRELGLLDDYNRSIKSSAIVRQTRLRCPLDQKEQPEQINIKNSIFQSL